MRQLQPMLVLENSGSVARDHLASERTFLAYVRTSLAVASTGVALVQLFTIAVNTSPSSMPPTFEPTSKRLQSLARPLGATTVIFGMIVLTIGMTRYFTIQTALTKGMFPVARMVISGITFGLSVLVVIVFGVLMAE
ncbi:Inner Membrane YidH-like protein [Pleurotus pulmonarius]